MTTPNDYESVKAKGTPYDALIRQEADRNEIPYEFMHKLKLTLSVLSGVSLRPLRTFRVPRRRSSQPVRRS